MSNTPDPCAIHDDYAQSANTLFHFMKELVFLKNILFHRAIVPRYCIETIGYLNLHNGKRIIEEIAVLQKCFCDIPFHKLADKLTLSGIGKEFEELSDEEKFKLENRNTHFDYYGNYAIAFSKRWGEENNLQPIHYLNIESQYTKDFSALFEKVINDENVSDEYVCDVLNRLSFIKPLRGIMKRTITKENAEDVIVKIYKNFHDEREWRYVPDIWQLKLVQMESIIVNPGIIRLIHEINRSIEESKYETLWLKFNYNDIKYIIVPDSKSRVELIEYISQLPEACFDEEENIVMQKSILISKLLVLEDIRRDW